MGFANTGVPHLVVLVDDLEAVDVATRGKVLRHHTSLEAGANVNFVAAMANSQWRMRTYERGVEGETLACGTGAVAACVMLESWELSGSETKIVTRSGRMLTVTVRHSGSDINTSLRGEGRIVFVGELAEA
jgi:diaminopimelate epimerase